MKNVPVSLKNVDLILFVERKIIFKNFFRI